MMKQSAPAMMMIAVTILASTMVCFAQDAAMVVDIKKGSAHHESEKKKAHAVMLADFLKIGEKIRLAPATLVLNYFASGIREEIAGIGTITIGKNHSEKTGDVKIHASKPDYLPPKPILSMSDVQQTGAVVFRGLGSIPFLSPTDTVIRSLRPFFQWPSVKEADSYMFGIYDVSDRPCFQTITTENHLRYDKSDLIRGECYEWMFFAVARGDIVAKGEGKFKILDEASLDKVVQTENKVRDAHPKDSPERMIILAMIYEQYELRDEAANMVKDLHQRHPRNRNIEKWMRNLGSAKGFPRN